MDENQVGHTGGSPDQAIGKHKNPLSILTFYIANTDFRSDRKT